MDLTQSLQDTLGGFIEFIPRLLAALVILLIGWIIAKVLEGAVVRVLRAVRVDHLLQRAGIAGPLQRAGFGDGAKLLAKILYYAIILIALQLAIDVLGLQAVQDVLNRLVALLPQIFVALVIVVITAAVANAVKTLFGNAIVRLPAGNLILNLVVAAIWVIGVFAAVDQVGVAQSIVDTLFSVLIGSLGLILVIKFGVGGVWAAKDRFWPAVYDKFSAAAAPTGQQPTTSQAGTQQPGTQSPAAGGPGSGAPGYPSGPQA